MTPGFWVTSSGVPSAIFSPKWMTITRPHVFMIAFSTCSMINRVVPYFQAGEGEDLFRFLEGALHVPHALPAVQGADGDIFHNRHVQEGLDNLEGPPDSHLGNLIRLAPLHSFFPGGWLP